MLYRTGQAVFLSRHFGYLRQGLEIDSDRGHRAIRQQHSTMPGPGLDADFRDSLLIRSQPAQVSGHESSKVGHGAVLLAHLPDFPAHRYDHALRLHTSNELRHLRGHLAVSLLLLLKCGPVQFHQRGRIYVYVEEARPNCLPGQGFNSIHFANRVSDVFPAIDLKMVSLNEHRALKALSDRRCQYASGVLRGALLRIANLRAGDLENKRADAVFQRSPENRAGDMVGDTTDVYRRHGPAGVKSAAGGGVQPLDAGRIRSPGLCCLPDGSAVPLLDLLIKSEDRLIDQIIDFSREQAYVQ